MSNATKKVGFECALYIGPADATLDSSHLYDDLTTASCNLTRTRIDVTTRAARGWRVFITGLKDAEITFDVISSGPGDTKYEFLYEAFLNNEQVKVFFSDGEGHGLEGVYEVFNFSEDQPIDDGIKNTVTIAPTGVAPTWIDDGPSLEDEPETEPEP